MRIQIINGPNLNLLGIRQPEVYGDSGFDTYFEELKTIFQDVELFYFQSNIEGEIIDMIQKVGFDFDGIVLNAGGYTHTSVAIHDAIKSVTKPVIEVHISNIHSREEFRQNSLIAKACKGSIAGFGFDSYRLGIEAIKKLK